MYAIRCARAYTERKAIMKIEGGYHGGYDALQVSVKPGLDEIGPADAPTPQVPVRRRGRHGARRRLQRPRAARPGARRARQRDRCAGHRAGHREPRRSSCPTRATSPASVRVRRPRRRADLRRGQDRPHRRATRVRPSGSASPPTSSPWPSRSAAACRWRRSAASARSWRSSSTAGWRTSAPTTATRSSWRPRSAVDEICTREALAEAEAVNVRALQAIDAIIDEYELPAHTVGSRGQGLRHLVDDAGAQLPRLQGHRLRPGRAVLAVGRQPAASSRRPASTSSGWCRWCTTDDDMATLVDDFRELAQALRA